MRLLCERSGLYFTAGPVFHKCLEVGFQRLRDSSGIDFCWRFTTRGDHAGLKFNFELFGLLFEFNVYDHRHWNWGTNAWEVYE